MKISIFQFTLNRLFLLVLMIGLLCLAVVCYVLLNEERESTIKQWQMNTLQRSTSDTSSYYAGLIQGLVLGKGKDVQDTLNMAKRGEKALAIDIVSRAEITLPILETCEVDSIQSYFHQIPTCIEYTDASLIVYHELRSTGYSLGYLRKEIKIPKFGLFDNKRIFRGFAVVILCFILVNTSILFTLRRFFIRPIQSIIASLSRDHEKLANVANYAGIKEIQMLAKAMNEAFYAIENYQNEAKNLEYEAKVGKLVSQVAHDIRSPLAALNVAASMSSDLPEDKRIMIRSAVQRINDIANDLAYRGDAKSAREENLGTVTEKASVQLLSSLIDSLVSEKRLQYRARLNVVIQSALTKTSYGLFAKIQTVQFKRVLSNLVNNAVEAIDNSGLVTVDLKTNNNDEIEIVVTDTGGGIAADKMPQLMQKGVSDKKDGQGLGLYHAKQNIESWGGQIAISSQLGSGTAVTITLPKQTEPDWFVPELKIYQGTKVLILDDDNSIHQIWKGRFDSLGRPQELHHFSNGDALREWAKINPNPGALLILCDYEIIGSAESGLDVIKELGLADHTVLVTSRYEEKNVRDECEKLGIKLLPKNLAGFVPIHIKEIPQDLEYVLIDDSRLNRQTWEIMARRNKKQLITFERAKDFYDVMDKVNKDTKLYVDYNLGHGENGGVVSKKISEKGFSRIYLATGDSSLDVKSMPWLAGIHGKGVPFGR